MRVDRGEFEALKAKAELYDLAEGELGFYVDLARSLQDRVNERLAAAGEVDIELSFESAVKDMEDDLVAQDIAKRVAALPDESLLGMYARWIGDDDVLEPLKTQAELRTQKIIHQNKLTELKQSIEKTGLLDLTLLPTDEKIEVGIYSEGKTVADYRLDTKANRIITGRISDPSFGEIEVLEDVWNRSHSGRPLKDHQLIRLGTVVDDPFDGRDPEFVPELTRGSAFAIQTDRLQPMRNSVYDIGFIRVGGNDIFANASAL